jgi:hypothetical protein
LSGVSLAKQSDIDNLAKKSDIHDLNKELKGLRKRCGALGNTLHKLQTKVDENNDSSIRRDAFESGGIIFVAMFVCFLLIKYFQK